MLDGDPAPPRKWAQQTPPPVRYCLITELAPLLDEDEDFSAHFAVARSPISATDELLFCYDLRGRSSYTFPQTFTIWHGRCIMSYIVKQTETSEVNERRTDVEVSTGVEPGQ